jgi:hypothetical protein
MTGGGRRKEGGGSSFWNPKISLTQPPYLNTTVSRAVKKSLRPRRERSPVKQVEKRFVSISWGLEKKVIVEGRMEKQQ